MGVTIVYKKTSNGKIVIYTSDNKESAEKMFNMMKASFNQFEPMIKTVDKAEYLKAKYNQKMLNKLLD